MSLRALLLVSIFACLALGCPARQPMVVDDAGVVDSGPPDAYVPPHADPTDPSTWVIEPERPALPPRPVWSPSFGPFGSADATTPYCTSDTGHLQSASIFASDHGIYAATRIENNVFSEEPWSLRPSGVAVHRWSGSAWEQRLRAPAESMTTAPALFVDADETYYLVWTFGCGLHRLVPGSIGSATLQCFRPGVADGESPLLLTQLASSMSTLVTNESVYGWTGSEFAAIPALSAVVDATNTVSSAWDDASVIALSGASGLLYSYDRGSQIATNLGSAVPAGDISAVAREPGGTYLVAYTTGALVRYDGVTSTPLQLDHQCPSYIRSFWSDGTSTYYEMLRGFGKIGAMTQQALIDLPCGASTSVRAMHGNGTDVYLAVDDLATINYSCGSTHVVRFDGTMFHQM